MKRTMLISLLSLPMFLHAQYNLEWSTLVNGTTDTTEYIETYYDQLIARDDSGFIYVAGNSIVGTSQDILVVKLNNSGNVVWTNQFDNGSQSVDNVNALTVDQQGNVLVLGSNKISPTDWDMELIQFSPTGNVNWVYSFSSLSGGGIDVGAELVVDTSNNSTLIGGLSLISTFHYCVIRVSSSGSLIDSVTYDGGTGAYAYPCHIERDPWGNVYLSGQHKNTNNNSDDGLLLKVDSSLSLMWVRTYDGVNGGPDYYYDLTLDNTGSPIVVGNENQGALNESFLMVKYDTAGTLQWSDNYTAPYYQSGTFRGVEVDEQGFIYAIGESDSSAVVNMNTIKYSPTGNIIWARSYCGVGMSFCSANDLAYKSGLVASIGYSVSPTNGIIAVYDTSGNVIWLHESTAFGGDGAYFAGLLDSVGRIYVSGIGFNPSSGNNDMWVQKFSPNSLNVEERENSFGCVYPNPTADFVQLAFPVDTYSVYDVTGKLVLFQRGDDITRIDLSSLDSGVYLISLDNNQCVRLIKTE